MRRGSQQSGNNLELIVNQAVVRAADRAAIESILGAIVAVRPICPFGSISWQCSQARSHLFRGSQSLRHHYGARLVIAFGKLAPARSQCAHTTVTGGTMAGTTHVTSSIRQPGTFAAFSRCRQIEFCQVVQARGAKVESHSSSTQHRHSGQSEAVQRC